MFTRHTTNHETGVSHVTRVLNHSQIASRAAVTSFRCAAPRRLHAVPGDPPNPSILGAAGAAFCKSAHGALFTFVFLIFMPLAARAADTAETPRAISLDVAAGGTLAALCGAATMWLMARRSRAEAERQPPLGEDVARTYASKADLAALDYKVSRDIESLRQSIDDNDRRAEDRARGTHARIDVVYKEQQKVNRSLGMLTGMLVGNKCSSSTVFADGE